MTYCIGQLVRSINGVEYVDVPEGGLGVVEALGSSAGMSENSILVKWRDGVSYRWWVGVDEIHLVRYTPDLEGVRV